MSAVIEGSLTSSPVLPEGYFWRVSWDWDEERGKGAWTVQIRKSRRFGSKHIASATSEYSAQLPPSESRVVGTARTAWNVWRTEIETEAVLVQYMGDHK